NQAALFLDGRMSGEVIRVLTADSPATDRQYAATLFDAGSVAVNYAGGTNNDAVLTVTSLGGVPKRRVVVGPDSSSGEGRVYNPVSGALKFTFHPFGSGVGVRLAMADVSGDHVPDLIVGSGKNLLGGAVVKVYDGTALFNLNSAVQLASFQPYGADYSGEV